MFSGSLGKPVCAASWGGLGVHPRRGRLGLPEVCRRRGSGRSAFRLAAFALLQTTLAYNLLRPAISGLSRRDASTPDVTRRLPSRLDERLIGMAIGQIDAGRESVHKYVQSIIGAIEESGLKAIDISDNRPLMGRVPFFARDRAHRNALIRTFATGRMELYVPYSTSPSRPHCPNADSVRRLAVAVTLKRKRSHCFLSRFQRCLNSLP